MAVKVDEDACIGCAACEGTCPQGVLEVEDKCVVAQPDDCIECGACVDVCPVNALSL